ncbi:hypothetical protein EDB19DRAFT_1835301 [Suillus lakei]|nr:hypothetical protein EDB19DRAFT_1835301 [Suillus lakei]
MYIYARELRNPRVKHAPDSLTLLASGVLSKTRQAFKNECCEHIRLVENSDSQSLTPYNMAFSGAVQDTRYRNACCEGCIQHSIDLPLASLLSSDYGSSAEELFKSSVYLTEVFTGVRLPLVPPRGAAIVPPDGDEVHISSSLNMHPYLPEAATVARMLSPGVSNSPLLHPLPLQNVICSKIDVPDIPYALLVRYASAMSTLTLGSTNLVVVLEGRPPTSDDGTTTLAQAFSHQGRLGKLSAEDKGARVATPSAYAVSGDLKQPLHVLMRDLSNARSTSDKCATRRLSLLIYLTADPVVTSEFMLLAPVHVLVTWFMKVVPS